jgi:hypothetical protein
MTEDEAQAWLQFRQIRHAWKPSGLDDGPRWSCRIMRSDKEGLRLYVQNKSASALLRLISVEAWAEYPTKKEGILAEKLRRFFSQEELRELAQEERSD